MCAGRLGRQVPPAEINRLVTAIRARSRGPDRYVLLTDRDRLELDAGIEQRRIPDWYLQEELLKGGCQAKLCLFEAGVLPVDMPAIYLDLDTMVLGDISQLLTVLDRPDAIAILQSAILPFGVFARWLSRRTGGRRYARGNSSIVVFHPAHSAYVAEQFRALFARHGTSGLKSLRADERFISWVAQPVMRAVPGRMVVKFPTEYMLPWRWLVYLRAGLPWVRRRRAGLLAVTFPGMKLKGEDLAALPEGATFTDRKGRRLFWSDWALGSLRAKIIAYYRSGDASGGP